MAMAPDAAAPDAAAPDAAAPDAALPPVTPCLPVRCRGFEDIQRCVEVVAEFVDDPRVTVAGIVELVCRLISAAYKTIRKYVSVRIRLLGRGWYKGAGASAFCTDHSSASRVPDFLDSQLADGGVEVPEATRVLALRFEDVDRSALLLLPTDATEFFGDEGAARAMRCAACGTPAPDGDAALRACGRCRAAAYCDADCQRRHWHLHRLLCRPA